MKKNDVLRYYLEDGKVVKGFFLVNFKKNLPHLQHCYLSKASRNINNLRLMVNVFKDMIKELGYQAAFLHARSERQMKLIRYFFNRKKPYAFENNIAWYKVDI